MIPPQGPSMDRAAGSVHPWTLVMLAAGFFFYHAALWGEDWITGVFGIVIYRAVFFLKLRRLSMIEFREAKFC